jgi:putative membrane-bound dehydrogenase-like protein
MPSIEIRRRCWLSASILLLFTAIVSAAEPIAPASQPLSPAEALTKFQLAEPGLKIELAAAEPDVIDPVAIRFDERGRMWVAEMRDYPLGPPAGEAPLSKIKVLEDTDHDGRFEKATVFAEKLSFVTGLQPWRGGVIVTLAGRIAWMKDTDNDGKCDVDETWYTGFAEQNSQLRANHPRLALDNHVYVANGLRGGVVVNKRLPNEPPINLQGRDFRFDPLTGKAESISGNGQFGMCFDDWGNRFTCTNRNPVIHVVLEDRYLKLAPKIPIAAVVQDVAAAAEKSKVYPISRAWTTSNLHAGTFTAACGVHVYRGDTLRNVLGTNSVFTCDPTGNFIHREVMQPDGPSFTSKPAYEGKEFLASTDEWFRPVDIELGPDGCLYIVDMYRCVIEHPDFVPDELKKRPDQRLGDDRGRIWRIAPKDGVSPERRKGLPLAERLTFSLLAELNSKNAWHRETAQRLFLSQDANDIADLGPLMLTEALPKLVLKSESPQQRVHILWLLKSMDYLSPEILFQNAAHEHAQVSRHAAIVAEGERPGATAKANKSLLSRREMSAVVEFQALLFELTRLDAKFEPPAEISPLLAAAEEENRWLQAAVLLRHQRSLFPLYEHSTKKSISSQPTFVELVRLIGSQASDDEAKKLLTSLVAVHDEKLMTTRIILLDSLARGLQTRGRRFEAVLKELKNEQDDDPLPATDICIFIAEDDAGLERYLTPDQQPDEVRLAAARLLGHMAKSSDLLRQILQFDSKLSPAVQTAVIASVSQRGDESKQVWLDQLSAYADKPLAIKRALIENSFRRGDGPKLLLAQVAAGVIQPAEIDPLRRKTLLESKDAALKKQAEELFATLNPANRQQTLEEYQPVLKLTADAKKGATIFEKNCSTCHRVGEIGVNVAPDISDSRTKTAAQLLADIIQPNRAIDSNFLGYQLLLKDGTAVSGLLSAETSTSLTLKQPGGKVLTVGRDEVEQLKATGVSLMPDGLEKNIPPESMADLLAYLKNWRYLDGKTPLSP